MDALSHMLRRFITTGTLRVIDATGKMHVFAGTPDPVVTIRLHDKALHRKLFLKPELHAGEAYMDGTLTVEDGTLYDFLALFFTNRSSMRHYPLQKVLRRVSRGLRAFQQHNPTGKAQKNVAHHYDLSRELYRRFLDRDLQYSCAYFLSEGDTLEQAQENKKRHIAAKLLLEPGMRVLDIGCGWGGLALSLAQYADVSVTGVTLSREQHEVAEARARELGLDNRVRFELRDYRELADKFDRVVSVGMFEHVGAQHFDEFFGKVSALLADRGVALIHSIGRRGSPGATGAWMRKYIFPGGYVPALSEVCAATERQKLWVTDVEVLRLHYAATLREWLERFEANRGEIAALYDDRFCRMWEFYLVASELSFRLGNHMVFQIQLSRERDAVPLTRDYMWAAERSYGRAPESVS